MSKPSAASTPPRSTADWLDADTAHFLHPFTDYKAAAQERSTRVLTRGSGCYLWDSDGKRYLDAFAGLACVSLGYGRQELADAAGRQMAELSYTQNFFKTTNKPAVRLAEELVRLTPPGLNHVFYGNSGSEANDTAIRIVRQYWQLEGQPEKRVIIGREAAYHGSTVAAAAVGGMPPMHEQAGIIPDVAHIKCPYQFEYGRGMSEEAFGKLAAGWLEEKILELGPRRVAAFFAEPVQGAGGMKMPPRNYFEEIQKICRKHDVLLVMDEVITGFGRTGRWFGSETYGVKQIDVMCLAKGITSGYIPLSAVMVGDRVAKTLIDKGGAFRHGFTYSGHPVSCAVALENIRILEAEGIVERVGGETGPYFAERLASLGNHPIVGEVRSVGLLGAFELVRRRAPLEPIRNPDDTCEAFRDLGLSQGIIIRPIHSTITLAPPLIISKVEIDYLVEQLRFCLDRFAVHLDELDKA